MIAKALPFTLLAATAAACGPGVVDLDGTTVQIGERNAWLVMDAPYDERLHERPVHWAEIVCAFPGMDLALEDAGLPPISPEIKAYGLVVEVMDNMEGLAGRFVETEEILTIQISENAYGAWWESVLFHELVHYYERTAFGLTWRDLAALRTIGANADANRHFALGGLGYELIGSAREHAIRLASETRGVSCE